MTIISAEVIEHSANDYGNELLAYECCYPRWIHAEGRTHRQLSIGEDEFDLEDLFEMKTPSLMADPNLSRNASSSRAIPVEKMIADMRANPAVPLFWGANQRGMQAGAECDERVVISEADTQLGIPEWTMSREDAWLAMMEDAIEWALRFDRAGFHKQIVNRILEPYTHIRVVVSATEWTNFFALRRHNDAEPHIHLLADRMAEAKANSVPKLLTPDDWHLPYVKAEERVMVGLKNAINLSVARCASVSYKTVDGQVMSVERATALSTKLLGSSPLHASPAEHQGKPDWKLADGSWANKKYHGNFVGFCQYRKYIPYECL